MIERMGNVFASCRGECDDNPASDVATESINMSDVLHVDEYVNDYKVVKELGAGSFGRVVLGFDNGQGEKEYRHVAIKIYSKARLSRQRDFKRVGRKMVVQTALEKVQVEIAIMKKLKHSNVVGLYEVIDTDLDPLYLVRNGAHGSDEAMYCCQLITIFLNRSQVLEFVPGGEILTWDPEKKHFRNKLPEPLARQAMHDCCAGAPCHKYIFLIFYI